jgi:hypothetical protein
MRRDPLTYQRAGVTGKAEFDTYVSLAVQAGVAIVGGEKTKWISLNPACGLGTPSDVPHDSFRLLVQRLQRLQSKDVAQPFRSLVAIDLVLQDKAVYQKAGVKDFDAYSTLAMKAGIVELGGEGPRAWISLKS